MVRGCCLQWQTMVVNAAPTWRIYKSKLPRWRNSNSDTLAAINIHGTQAQDETDYDGGRLRERGACVKSGGQQCTREQGDDGLGLYMMADCVGKGRAG